MSEVKPKKGSMYARWALDEKIDPSNPLGLEKIQGHWVSYYDNGQKKEEGNYNDGKQVGKWIYYNSDGSIEKTEEY